MLNREMAQEAKRKKREVGEAFLETLLGGRGRRR